MQKYIKLSAVGAYYTELINSVLTRLVRVFPVVILLFLVMINECFPLPASVNIYRKTRRKLKRNSV